MSMASIDLVFVSLRAFWRASLLKQLLGAAVLVGPGDVDDFLGRLYAAFAQPKPNDGGDTREHHGAAVIGGNASVAQCESAMPCALFEQLPDDLLHAVTNLHIRSVTGEGGDERVSLLGITQGVEDALLGDDVVVFGAVGGPEDDPPEVVRSSAVNDYSPICYQSVTKAAGTKGDDQNINLLVPKDEKTFTTYLDIRARESGKAIPLPDDGAVISERLAALAGVRVGDTMTFKDGDGIERSVRVTGICEMYLEHFMFMSPQAYRACFAATRDFQVEHKSASAAHSRQGAVK